MAAFVRAEHPDHPVGSLQRALGLGAAPDSSLVRSRFTRRQAIGRVVLIWAVAYAIFRFRAPFADALAQALLFAASWALIAARARRAFSTMTFAIGSFAVSSGASIGAVVVLSVADDWLSRLDIDNRALAVAGLATFAAAGIWDQLIRRTPRPPQRVLVVGGGQGTADLLEALAHECRPDIEVIGIVDDDLDPELALRVQTTGRLDSLVPNVRRLSPDLVVVAVQRGRPEVFAQLLGAADAGFQVVGLPEMFEYAFGRLPVETLTPAWFMSVLHAYNRPASRAAKRAFDLATGAVGILLALPLVPFIVILVKRTPGPLLYRQTRLGEHGTTFTMLKFRSMRADAEAEVGATWAAVDDSRIIPGGKLLRKLRLDELPQLWNVVRGEMSIVGPRPERPEFLAQLQSEVPFWTQRHLLKPGVTGWAQIRAGYAADAMGTMEKLSYDLWYLRHRSLLLDTFICLRTVPRMITFGGAR
jgi:exopolysaccharide biosynthesis polyprenyl glycosylphosphotransferase